MDISNKEILRSMVEHKAESIINSIDGAVIPLFSNNPAIGKIAQQYVSKKQREFIPQIQEYCDLLVETSCLDPDITLEEAIINAENIINAFISDLIRDKIGLPAGAVNISLQVLFGEDILKL